MSIFPLQQFEADLEADRAIYEALKPPTSIVVRFGVMKMVGEFPYAGDQKPGCGSKIVVRTHRGLEIGEMLTSTCPNAGCSKSVTRQEMLEYIESSGGRDYPFHTDGRAIRIATVEDLQRQSALEATRKDIVRAARVIAQELLLEMKVVDAEPILGGEVLTIFFTSEDRVDFRELARRLAEVHRTRIELRQVGARDEARLTADYERCGQHCCCKQFLKVLKPVSMRSAKVQKSTLDPLKISGRCGRLMCCLRYEDETYETLRKRLPHRGTRVGTPEGPGSVVDSQILTQLVLVQLETADGAPKQIAVPVEDLCDPDAAPKPKPAPDPMRGASAERIERRTRPGPGAGRDQPPGAGPRSPAQRQDAYRARAQSEEDAAAAPESPAPQRDQRPRRPRNDGSRPPQTGGRPPQRRPAPDRPAQPPAPPLPPDAGAPEGERPAEGEGEGSGGKGRRRRGRRGRGRGRPEGPGPAAGGPS